MTRKRIAFYFVAFFFFSTPLFSQSFKEQYSFNLFADSVSNYSSLWIDLDQDYDYDLLNLSVLNKPTKLYLNQQGNVVPQQSIFSKDGGNANGACYADIDLDGDLDIFIYSIFGQKNFLYIQEAKGLFSKDISPVFCQTENNAFHAIFSDVNLDNHPDLVITDTELWNPKSVKKFTKIFLNDGTGKFNTTKSLSFSVPNSDTRNVLLSDFNQDGREDLLLINFGSSNELYLKNEGNIFNRVSVNFCLQKGDYNDAKSIDFDNDGDLDLLVSNLKTGIEVYRNDGHLLFTKIENVFSITDYKISSMEIFDWNHDGAMDVLINKAFGTERKLFINNDNSNNWINLKLRADRANLDAVQAKVYVKTQTKDRSFWQYQELKGRSSANISTGKELHFGIGTQTNVDSVKIVWPDGTEEIHTNILANKSYFIEQRKAIKELIALAPSAYKINRLKDLNVSVVADYFKYGEVAGITVFYENKGRMEEDIELKINLSLAMKFVNSFPMPNSQSATEYTYIIKSVPAQYRGIITLALSTPNIEDTAIKEQQITVEIEPRIGDENPEDNLVTIKKKIE